LFAAAGCGGSKESKAPPIQRAQGFADDFVHRLVVVGRWDAVASDVAPLQTRPLRHFQDSIRRDGIREVQGPGTLRHDCPVSPNVGAGKDCFVYRLRGRQVVPNEGIVVLNPRYRLWVKYVDGLWQVVSFDYDLRPAA
jgi:hypothetical protein